jgi:hypothetical protein
VSSVDDAIRKLRERRQTLRCKELIEMLEALGFIVKPAASGGHRTFTHPALSDFFGSGFNCGHNATKEQVRPGYLAKISMLLRKYQKDLERHLGEATND